MSSLETELEGLRAKNNDLVKKVQHWKMTAAQRENEKLDLMKENNELRLKLSRLRSGGAAHARKLDAEIQSASKQALAHLVQASSAVTRTVQLTKTYMQKRQELESSWPRWSSISNTPSSEKVHRVPPLLIGGQSIQPVVSLSRTMVNLNNLRTNRSPNNNHNHNFPQRALPMHMLQDLYIPLTRIDANGLPVNGMDVDSNAEEDEVNNSSEDLELNDNGDRSPRESQNVSAESERYEDTGLDVVEETSEPEDVEQSSPKPITENPLEGPSWMLDAPTKSRINLEPDSTTECDGPRDRAQAEPSNSSHRTDIEFQCDRLAPASTASCAFSPTVRRRKRTASPAPTPVAPHTPHAPHTYSHRTAGRRNSNNGRVLKVLVSKLRLDEDDVTPPKRPSLDISPCRPARSPVRTESTDSSPVRRQSRDVSPAKRQDRDKSPSSRLSRDMHLLSFDAPSPNGATTSHVVISETASPFDAGGSGEPAAGARRVDKHPDSDSGSSVALAAEGRTRRPRKAVIYKEKPLNRKMRR